MYSIKLTESPQEGLFPIVEELKQYLADSRFTCTLEPKMMFKRSRLSSSGFYYGAINISTIRLKKAKQYCGNHAGPCLLTFELPKKKYKYLEGADWVEFNDTINDFLDKKKLSAVVESAEVRVRLNNMRRVYYSDNGYGVWNKYGHADDYECGFKENLQTVFTYGTPGIYKEDYRVVG